MTEEVQQSDGTVQNDSCSVQNDTQSNSSDVGKVKDNKKEKCRPLTKVCLCVIRGPMTDTNFSRCETSNLSRLSRYLLTTVCDIGYVK